MNRKPGLVGNWFQIDFENNGNLKYYVEIQNSEVNNVYNVIKVQKANTKSSAGQHGPPRQIRR
jgi:hypothetical protein